MRLRCHVMYALHILALNVMTMAIRINICTSLRIHIDDVREVPSVNHTMIDLVENASVWREPGLSLVHEIRSTFARSTFDQSEAIFICIFMQAVFANRRVVKCFLTDFCVCVSYHN
jgi:hypothetical protein